MQKKKLPIGIDDFEKLRTDDFYYVDKTGLIRELLQNWGEVNLLTRPRRFGKSLNITMLENFFSPESNKRIFDGLEISKEKSLCEEYMGKYPVISISLKGIDALSYEKAFRMAVRIVIRAASKVQYLTESDALSKNDKSEYLSLLDNNMDEAVFCDSLRMLSELLEKHFGEKVVLLIDEYDVPLARAFENGYYEQMLSLIRSLLGQALKTNSSLKFAVLTGCLRISKESIFTGLNNLKVMTIADERFDEYFGFTENDVRELLEYYGAAECYDTIKKWYDGYQFGNENVFCPWDVLNYCDRIRMDLSAQPENYWINTSDNHAVKQFLRKSENAVTKREIEELVAGGVIIKEIHQELTYPEMYKTTENIWSLLYMTGYLTQRGKAEGRKMSLAIPNLEIRDIFVTQIMELFKENVMGDGETLNRFCEALKNGEAESVENIFTEYLRKTISIRDTFVRKEMKENFYHGILLGILGVKERWGITSNRETGSGYADILVEPDTGDTGIVIEVKYAHDGDLEAACHAALEQAEDAEYEEALLDDGVQNILKYGIACYKKRCKVMAAEKQI
ncbi:ATP-binding protein [Ruminococcus sp. CLA-AA-H200]|uniref:ATP-binding protein n=1 Tax=Ruminococcus turbiniformis TaxID=2881258 RepID=A0ABS8FW86_9FIRM|nr:AAA family ATPase [Ruminococcus turbiniformis]MCC2253879.1 ATP-binding protein [Ruminococcus turbiniformis]